MELGQLAAFEAAARTGSFTRTADELDLTQPSVSARIAALEAELGGPLFERGGRGLKLTALGRIFLPYTERALATTTDGMAAVRRFYEGKLGNVRIAALREMGLYMLAEPMERFREEYPEIDFSINLRPFQDVLDLLHSGEATIGLLGAPVWDTGLAFHASFQDEVRAVAAADHPLAVQQREQGPLSLHDLMRYPILRVGLSPRVTAMVTGIAEQARQSSGGAVVSVPGVMAIRQLILGNGVAFLPRLFIEYHLEVGKLALLDVHDMGALTLDPLLVSLTGRELDVPNQAFIRMVRARWHEILVN
jgi:DNA-binding transcriptional LysR family regulator